MLSDIWSPEVIPGRDRTSAVADVRIYKVPISGKPEIGCGEPGMTAI
jgi:hypothetical protein